MVEARRIYIHAAAALGPHGTASAADRKKLTSDPNTDLRPLAKQVLGQGLRQASHFVELAAIGARLCLNRLGRPPEPDTAVYLGTALGEIRKTESLFEQVLPPGPGTAAPFDFINATSNMASFYVARVAGTSARNLTVTQGVFSFEWALKLAMDDLRAGLVKTALVGGVDENHFPRSQYERRWPLSDDEIMGEGSAWLYLSPEAAGAVAELLWMQNLPPTDQLSDWARLVTEIHAGAERMLVLVCGNRVMAPERNVLSQRLPQAAWRTYIEYCGNYPTAASFGIASSMEGSPAPGQWVHVNRDAEGRTMLVGWCVART